MNSNIMRRIAQEHLGDRFRMTDVKLSSYDIIDNRPIESKSGLMEKKRGHRHDDETKLF